MIPGKEPVSFGVAFEEITISELRQHPGDILSQTALGKIFLITKHWKPIAVLSKLPGATLTIVDDHGRKVITWLDAEGNVHYAP